jgi:hypothetical protein
MLLLGKGRIVYAFQGADGHIGHDHQSVGKVRCRSVNRPSSLQA